VNPIVIHAISAKYEPPVVPAEPFVKPKQPFSFQFKEHGIDELYHVIASHLGQ
jgi:hypothetical protein